MKPIWGLFRAKSRTIKNSPHGPWDKYPLATPSNGEIIRLLLNSLHHGDLYIFIQPGSNTSETLRPHTWPSHNENDLDYTDDGPHVSAHGARQVPSSTGCAGMSMVVERYILHKHARHSPDCMCMSSRLPHQNCSMMVISESFNTQQAKDRRFRVDKDTKVAVVWSLQ